MNHKCRIEQVQATYNNQPIGIYYRVTCNCCGPLAWPKNWQTAIRKALTHIKNPYEII